MLCVNVRVGAACCTDCLFNSQVLILQGWANPGPQVVPSAEFCAVAPDICWSSAWNFHRVVLLAPRILSLDLCKIRETLSNGVTNLGRQVGVRNKFCMAVTKLFWSSAWDVFGIIFLVHRI